ncbi:MAG: efflux RND transporter periplasmic adaptor subunit [Rickettsiales bacterium]
MKKALICVVASIVLAGGAYAFFAKRRAEQGAGAPGAAMPPLSVSVVALSPQPVSYTHVLPGRTAPYRQAQVRPQVNGVIVRRFFEEGSEVKQGDQLYQINDVPYKAALRSAEADLAGARANVASVASRAARYRTLVKLNAVSKQEFDDAMAEKSRADAAVSVAQAAVETAKINVEYTKVYAPISGRIGRSLVTEGALATANQEAPLAVITQLDPIYVDIQQSGEEATRMRKRLREKNAVEATLTLARGEEYGMKGALKFSETTVEESTGAVTMRAVFPNPEEILLPGLFVKTRLASGEGKALLVPQRAATRTPDGKLVVAVVGEGNVVSMRPFVADGAYKDGWIVKSGLKEGETIVVEGYQKTGDGMKVSPSPFTDAPSPASSSK